MTDTQNQTNQSDEQNQAPLEKQAAEYLAGWQRAKADFINYKKEQEKRNQEVVEYANASLLAELLPIYNNFKLAIKHVPTEARDEEWVKGFSHVQRQFVEFFKSLGIEEIETVGAKFDPNKHEAVSHETVDGSEPDTIFEEVAPGYTLHGKLLQVAKVKVAK